MIEIGQIIVKKNFKPFGSSGGMIPQVIFIRVESVIVHPNGTNYLNGYYGVNPDHVKVITAEEAAEIQLEFDNCQITEHIIVDGRDPHIREDTNTPKLPVPELGAREFLFEMRRRKGNNQYELYRCPQCQQLHLGKNPSKLVTNV